ncbi:golgin-45 [Ciona intestinalis]
MATISASPILSLKPPHLQIDRDPSWKNTPREVGDGMESDISRSTLPPPTITTTTPNLTKTPEKQTFETSEIYSVSQSPCSSPRCVHREVTRTIPEVSVNSVSKLNFSFKEPDIQLQRKTSEKFLIEEKSALKDHLQIQIQVNQELKRLLVASVGDELGYHYERLATEKAQLQIELDQMTEIAQKKTEEIERLEISCDVWRSKFLASRMQSDDANAWRRHHERYERELGNAVRGLLREHWERTEHLNELHRTLTNINNSLTKENDDCYTGDIEGSSSVGENCRSLANSLSDRLIGTSSVPLPRKPAFSVHCDIPAATPAEKYVLQLLNENQHTLSNVRHRPDMFVPSCEQRKSGTIDRFHSQAQHDNITLDCCVNCKGEIHVI